MVDLPKLLCEVDALFPGNTGLQVQWWLIGAVTYTEAITIQSVVQMLL